MNEPQEFGEGGGGGPETEGCLNKRKTPKHSFKLHYIHLPLTASTKIFDMQSHLPKIKLKQIRLLSIKQKC